MTSVVPHLGVPHADVYQTHSTPYTRSPARIETTSSQVGLTLQYVLQLQRPCVERSLGPVSSA
jgi:hypothetical protein